MSCRLARLLNAPGCSTFDRPFPTGEECRIFVAFLKDFESQCAPTTGAENAGDRLAGLTQSYDRNGAQPTMSMINYASREVNCKIVYYGTGLGGKTTNLEYVYSPVNSDAKGKMIFLATETEGMEADIEAMHNLYENLESYGYDLTQIPFSLQYNKRDLSNAMEMEERRSQLNPGNVPDFEGVAIEGKGVFETLGAVSKLVVQTLS